MENSIEEDIKNINKGLYELEDSYELHQARWAKRIFENIKEKLEHILSDYKKLQEDFEQIDNECNRLEKIDFEKDMKIKELQKENEKLKNNTRKNENESEVGIDCNWDALQKVLDETEKINEYIIYDNEKWIKEKYCIPVQKIKDIIDRIDYDIKNTKEIISKNTNIYASHRKNDYQIVRLRAMNTKSLDIKNRLQKLLKSEE